MGAKDQTTIAFTPEADARYEWLGDAKFPPEIPEEQHGAFAEMIRAHPPFRRGAEVLESARV